MAEKSGKSGLDIFKKLGYKTVADMVCLIWGLFLFIILLIDFLTAMINGLDYVILGVPVSIAPADVWNMHWGIWTVLLIFVGMVAIAPTIAKISTKLNTKLKLMPEVDVETSKRMILFMAWLISVIMLLINNVFWEDNLSVLVMSRQFHQFYFFGISFILLTLVILQDIIKIMKKEI